MISDFHTPQCCSTIELVSVCPTTTDSLLLSGLLNPEIKMRHTLITECLCKYSECGQLKLLFWFTNKTSLFSASCWFQWSNCHKHVVNCKACWMQKCSSGTLHRLKLAQGSRLGSKQIMRCMSLTLVWWASFWYDEGGIPVSLSKPLTPKMTCNKRNVFNTNCQSL